MAATVGISATRKNLGSESHLCQTSGLKEGAVVAHKQTGDNQDVVAPSGAAAKNLAGVLMDQQPAAGTTAGDACNIQYAGIAICQLAAGLTATKGNLAIVSGTDGSVKQWTNETDCDVVGVFEATLTAGSANDFIPVRLGMYRKT